MGVVYTRKPPIEESFQTLGKLMLDEFKGGTISRDRKGHDASALKVEG
jgi:hypothetical protein